MSKRSRAQLQAVFKTGAVPNESNFADLFDSFLSLQDTGVDSMAGSLDVSKDFGVSATAEFNFLAVSGNTQASALTASGNVAINGALQVSATARFPTDSEFEGVNADTINVVGTGILKNAWVSTVDDAVSAAGSNQSTAQQLTARFNLIQTGEASQGVKTDLARTGQDWIVFNRTANNINLYPASGAQIEGLGVNNAVEITALASLKLRYVSDTQGYIKRGAEQGALTPQNSLEFVSASKQYLQIATSEIPTFNYSKFGIAGSFFMNPTTSVNNVPAPIFSAYASAGARGFELFVNRDAAAAKQALLFAFYSTANSFIGSWQGSAGSIENNTWYAYYAKFDFSQPTGDRIKVIIDNVSATAAFYTAPTGPSGNASQFFYAGSRAAGDNPRFFNGLLHNTTLFSGTLPSNEEIFAGGGKTNNLAILPGAVSSLDASTATSDAILSTNWTNVNAVTVTAKTP